MLPGNDAGKRRHVYFQLPDPYKKNGWLALKWEGKPVSLRIHLPSMQRIGAIACTACALLSAIPLAAAAEQRPKSPAGVYGPEVRPSSHDIPRIGARRRSSASIDALRYWNQVAIDASGLDHTPVAPGETRVFGEQLGPGRSSRAMAIVHIAMFDAVNAMIGGYVSYTGMHAGRGFGSVDAAIASAAHDTLIDLFPSQKNAFDQLYAEDLRRISDREERRKRNGIKFGQRAAAAILAMRRGDGANNADPKLGVDWDTNPEPGHWRQDPVGHSPIALGAHWSDVPPFVIPTASQFRASPPPELNSAEYAVAFNEVKSLGGDGVITPTRRTAEQTHIGIYWAYDGTPSLCAPPRLYNEVAVEISKRETRVLELARLLALVNVAMADASLAIWESKYFYDVWRPVTGIRESDEGTGPTGAGDGNKRTIADTAFMPLGAPASNLTGPNFTPPFPSYPSGHAGFGGALFEILRRFYASDRISFSFLSDEFNGQTMSNDGTVRPYAPRTFSTLSEAEEENGQSRIYLGIHWAFDKTAGIKMGQRVADYVFAHAFQRER